MLENSIIQSTKKKNSFKMEEKKSADENRKPK